MQPAAMMDLRSRSFNRPTQRSAVPHFPLA
jgi:hypothetical protein